MSAALLEQLERERYGDLDALAAETWPAAKHPAPPPPVSLEQGTANRRALLAALVGTPYEPEPRPAPAPAPSRRRTA